MGNRAKKFVRVPLLLQRVRFDICEPVNNHFRGHNFGGLTFSLRSLYFALNRHAASGRQMLDFGFVVFQLAVGDNLNVALAGAVVQLQKRKAPFAVAPRANPAA